MRRVRRTIYNDPGSLFESQPDGAEAADTTASLPTSSSPFKRCRSRFSENPVKLVFARLLNGSVVKYEPASPVQTLPSDFEGKLDDLRL
jgi:hypothetical protein